MRNNSKKDVGKMTFRFESLFFILLLCIPISLLAQQTTKPMDVNDLLELSLASFESLPPYSMRVEVELSFIIPQESIDAEFEVIEIRYDKRRIDKIAQQYYVKDKQKKLVWVTRKIWTGEQLQSRQQYLGSGIAQEQQIDASGSFKDDTKNILISPYSGGFVSGFMIGDKEHVCNILKQSGVATLYGKTGAIGGNSCYVVEGKTQSGTYKIWIDPNNGFNVRKAIVNKKIGDLYHNKLITSGNSDKKVMVECEVVMSDVEVEKVGDYYIPISATLVQKKKYSDGTISHINWSSKRSKIQLNPNFEEMGAFVMDGIPEGTRVSVDSPGIIFIWQDGKVMPINIQPVPLIGKQLPELKDLQIDILPTDANDKMMLVCFFDMDQRPSRNCLRQLSTRAKELMTKDIVVVAVQSSKIDDSVLNEWVEKNNICFPVGIVRGDEEKTRFTWSVRSLPWLIITDKEHVITAEGFALQDLDERIEKASEAKQQDGTNERVVK